MDLRAARRHVRAHGLFAPARPSPPGRGSARPRPRSAPWRTCVRSRRGRTAATAASRRFPQHERDTPASADDLVALIEALMFEGHDALGRTRFAVAQRDDLCFRADGVAGEDGLGEARPPPSPGCRRVVPSVVSCTDRPTTRPSVKIELIERPAELCRLGVFVIDVDRRRVVGQRREQDVVHVRYGAADLVHECLRRPRIARNISRPNDASLRFSRPKIDTAATLLNGAPPRLWVRPRSTLPSCREPARPSSCE